MQTGTEQLAYVFGKYLPMSLIMTDRGLLRLTRVKLRFDPSPVSAIIHTTSTSIDRTRIQRLLLRKPRFIN